MTGRRSGGGTVVVSALRWRHGGVVVVNFFYLPIHLVMLLFIFFPNVHFGFFPSFCCGLVLISIR